MSQAYQEYQQTLHWSNIRRLAIVRAEYRCQLCGLETEDLVVHHRGYSRLGTAAELKDVVALCRDCHELFHASGKVQEPDWTDRIYRQPLYKALAVDKAMRRINASFEERDWTIITAGRPDNCLVCQETIAAGDRVRYGGKGIVCCLDC